MSRSIGKFVFGGLSLFVQGWAAMTLFKWFLVPLFHAPAIGLMSAVWGCIFCREILVRDVENLPEIKDSIGFALRCAFTVGTAYVVRMVPWLRGGL